MKNDFIKAAFSTDPRVLAWAALKYEVKPDDKEALVKAVDAIYEKAKEGLEPQRIWLNDARELAERIGQAWDFRDEKAEDVLKEAVKHDFKRQLPPTSDLLPSPLPPWVRLAPSRAQEIALGLPSTRIPPCTTVTIATESYLPFRLRRLIINESIAAHVHVIDLKIGKNCQFGNSAPIAGSVFSSRAFPLPLNCYTAQTGQLIQLTVSNQAGAEILFAGALHGVGLT